MPKYNKKIVNQICSLVKKDNYTVAEICSAVGIAESTYFDWKANRPEFSESLTRARDQFDETLVQEAKNSLRKKVNGYEVDEKKTVYVNGKDGKPVIKEQTTIKKHFQPDTDAIKFVLTNKASEEYQNRQNNELTGKGGKDLFAGITDEELDNKIAELEKKLSKNQS